jgi:hypothetical protein
MFAEDIARLINVRNIPFNYVWLIVALLPYFYAILVIKSFFRTIFSDLFIILINFMIVQSGHINAAKYLAYFFISAQLIYLLTTFVEPFTTDICSRLDQCDVPRKEIVRAIPLFGVSCWLQYLFICLVKDININATNISEAEKRYAQLDKENIQLEKEMNIYNDMRLTENISPLENAVKILKGLICSVKNDELALKIEKIIGNAY